MTSTKNISVYRTHAVTAMAVIVAFTYAAVLSGLPLEAFKDRANYLVYARSSAEILQRYYEQGMLSTLSNEPLWLSINIFLQQFFTGEWIVRTIIFVPAFAISWTLLRQDPENFLWLLIFLLIAQVIKNHVVHLRQGVAIALFVVGWFSSRSFIRWPLMLSAAFVHASFFFVLGILAIVSAGRFLRLDASVRLTAVAIAALVTGLGLEFLAQSFGARQAVRYDVGDIEVSGLGFVFWAGIFCIFLSEGRRFRDSQDFEMGALIFYLVFYFLTPVSARIFESTLVLILLTGLGLTRWRRTAFLTGIVGFSVLQYAFRWQQSWLGWAIA